MKNTLGILFTTISTLLLSQVGINTDDPKTTMDVSAARNSQGLIIYNDQPIGLQAPRLTRAELTSITASYTTDQRGSLLYITDISGGNRNAQRTNIDAIGYYYFDGLVWIKIGNGSITAPSVNLYNSNGTLTENRTVSEGAHTLSFTGTAVGANKFINIEGTPVTPKSAIQIIDGSQSLNNVLTSDNSGNATWKPVTISRLEGVLGVGIDIPFTASNFLRTGSYINLPPGKWEVSITMLMPVTAGTLTNADWLWLKSTFSELNQPTIIQSQATADFVGTVYLSSGLFSGPKAGAAPKYNMMYGTLVINNKSTTAKAYYYYAGLLDREFSTGTGKSSQFNLFGGNNWGENVITATRLQ